jgi:hypothetical protein
MSRPYLESPSGRLCVNETWIGPEADAYNTFSGAPTGSNRRGLVRFPDGKLRLVRLGVPDTYFSIPAKPARGRIGTVMLETVDDMQTGDAIQWRFYPRADCPVWGKQRR